MFAECNQQYATFHNLFISVRRSTCFRRGFRPSPGAQNCAYSGRYFSEQYCYLLLALTFRTLFISVRRSTCFRRVVPSIIRSSKLHIQRQVFVRPILLPAVSPKVSQFTYFCKTLYIFQTGFPSIIRSSKLHIQRQTCYLLLAWPQANGR